VENEGPVENFSPDLFSVDDVHRIAILDLRIMNLDRNECNILVAKARDRKGHLKRTLVPIDHGLSIPDCLTVCSYDLVWLGWSQAEEPFSRKSLQYIEQINIMKDLRILESAFKFRPICLRNIRISTTLLKKAAAAGLTLAQIGQILCREDEDGEPSILENIVRQASSLSERIYQLHSKEKSFPLLGFAKQDSAIKQRNRLNSTIHEAQS